MSDIALRGIVAAAIVAVAAGIGMAARRWSRPSHPGIDPSGIPTSARLVIFTSTDCARCAEARQRAEATGASIREVTHELEPALFARAGVEAVPLTVVVGNAGEAAAWFAGVPRRRELRRAIAAAGGPVLGSGGDPS